MLKLEASFPKVLKSRGSYFYSTPFSRWFRYLIQIVLSKAHMNSLLSFLSLLLNRCRYQNLIRHKILKYCIAGKMNTEKAWLIDIHVLIHFSPLVTFRQPIRVLCTLLKKISYLFRCTDMLSLFEWNSAALGLMFNEKLDFIYQRHHQKQDLWNLFFSKPSYRQRYADAVTRKVALRQNYLSLVDGTVVHIYKSISNQMVAYNGHKWVHDIKFQSSVWRNGLITNLVT